MGGLYLHLQSFVHETREVQIRLECRRSLILCTTRRLMGQQLWGSEAEVFLRRHFTVKQQSPLQMKITITLLWLVTTKMSWARTTTMAMMTNFEILLTGAQNHM